MGDKETIMKFHAVAIALMSAASLTMLSTAPQAASLAVGKKLELEVDAKKMNEERAALWARFGGWCAIKDWHPAVAKSPATTRTAE